MTRSKSARTSRWSWTTGEKGRNKVHVFTHPKSGRLFLKWFETASDGATKARTKALGHENRDQAKQEAEQLAATLRTSGPTAVVAVEVLTVGALFDMFEQAMRDVGRLRGVHTRVGRTMRAFFGGQHAVRALDEHELERYLHARRRGTVVVSGKRLGAVRDRALQEDMETLRRVLRWAVRKKTADGRRLLPEMPIDDWDFVPKEKNPHRPMLTSDAYAQMREKAWDVDPRLYVALVVCHETGHRLNAVRCLRWSDVDLTGRTLTWRGEHQKNGHDSVVPITETAVEALRRYQRHTGGIGAAWLFPGRTAGETLSRDQFYEWWKLVREAAELPPEVRLGFHAFRRKLASELATAPLAMVKALGGWKHPHVVVQVYQAPTVEQQRKVLENRQKFAAGE